MRLFTQAQNSQYRFTATVTLSRDFQVGRNPLHGGHINHRHDDGSVQGEKLDEAKVREAVDRQVGRRQRHPGAQDAHEIGPFVVALAAPDQQQGHRPGGHAAKPEREHPLDGPLAGQEHPDLPRTLAEID